MTIEYERKYLVTDDGLRWILGGCSPLTGWGKHERSEEIVQHYIVSNSKGAMRIRGTTTPDGQTKYELAVKIKDDVHGYPDEEERVVDHMMAKALQQLSSGVVEKTRMYIVEQGETWMVDIYHGANRGLVTAEIEFESLVEVDNFSGPPSWVGADVTTHDRYKNSALASWPFTKWETELLTRR